MGHPQRSSIGWRHGRAARLTLVAGCALALCGCVPLNPAGQPVANPENVTVMPLCPRCLKRSGSNPYCPECRRAAALERGRPERTEERPVPAGPEAKN